MTSLEILNRTFVKNDRQAFDLVYDHLLSQGEKSMIYDNDCAYRAKDYDEALEASEFWFNGKSCAVGCLIKNDYYDEDIELTPVDSDHVLDIVRDSHPEWGIDSDSVVMLQLLQKIHDSIWSDSWEIMLNAAKELLFEENIIVKLRNDEYKKLYSNSVHSRDMASFIYEEMEIKAQNDPGEESV